MALEWHNRRYIYEENMKRVCNTGISLVMPLGHLLAFKQLFRGQMLAAGRARQRKRKGRARAGRAFNPEPAAEARDNLAADRQTQPSSPQAIVHRIAELAKLIED